MVGRLPEASPSEFIPSIKLSNTYMKIIMIANISNLSKYVFKIDLKVGLQEGWLADCLRLPRQNGLKSSL